MMPEALRQEESVSEILAGNNSAPGFAKHSNYEIRMQPFQGDVSVMAGPIVIANSHNAILLTETGHSPVYYLPRANVCFDVLQEIDISTYCPFKGHAVYWCVAGDGSAQPVMWAYATPYDEVVQLADYVAFYGDRVTLVAMKK